jgi:hypothetical protein
LQRGQQRAGRPEDAVDGLGWFLFGGSLDERSLARGPSFVEQQDAFVRRTPGGFGAIRATTEQFVLLAPPPGLALPGIAVVRAEPEGRSLFLRTDPGLRWADAIAAALPLAPPELLPGLHAAARLAAVHAEPELQVFAGNHLLARNRELLCNVVR